MSGIGPAELLIIVVLLGFALPIWAIVDALTRPDSQWAAVGQSKMIWVLVLVIGIFVPLVGIVVAIVYLATIRPKLKRAG